MPKGGRFSFKIPIRNANRPAAVGDWKLRSWVPTQIADLA